MFSREESYFGLILVMNVTIVIPTFNNIDYLKLCLKSIKVNSNYEHEVVVHVNEGSDGSLNFVKNNHINYTHSRGNIGLCSAVNKAATLSTTDYILYAHDDMYFCKDWDLYLEKIVKMQKSNLFYLSGKTISDNDINNDFKCGLTPNLFNEDLFEKFCSLNKSENTQGSHWAPHLIHKDVWKSVGGFSEEFNPGDGSDPDLCIKLWHKGVRVFMCIGNFKVYHFESVTIRKSSITKNNGTKKFLLKWGFNPRFFRKYYLDGDHRTTYEGPLSNPSFSFSMCNDLLINKIKLYYYKLFNAK